MLQNKEKSPNDQKDIHPTPSSVGYKWIISLTAVAEDIYPADKTHQWAEMWREVAHQTNLLEFSLGGHSRLNGLLGRRQLSVCITCSFKETQGLMWCHLHTRLCPTVLQQGTLF